jgi:hypothetical protein
MFRFAAAMVMAVCASFGGCASSKHTPTVHINLARGLPSEEIVIAYVLEGAFGTYGHHELVKVSSASYLIKTSVGRKLADRIRVIVWTPGCEALTFDNALGDSPDITRSFSCAPLLPVTLSGQIHPVDLLHQKASEVSVVYEANWLCVKLSEGLVEKGKFWGGSCLVPQFSLGRARVNARGIFEIKLPGLTRPSVLEATLDLTVSEIKSRKFRALEPESEDWREAHALRIASSYPKNLAFVEQNDLSNEDLTHQSTGITSRLNQQLLDPDKFD